MKKRWILALMLVLCVCILAGCQGKETPRYNVKTAGDTQQQSAPVTNVPAVNEEDYNPLVEEDSYTGDDNYWASITTAPPVVTAAPTVRSEYAGATPVLIDPIDKPTPTPVPPLSFTYQVYDATKLGLSFEGPAGWTKDDSMADTFIIQNPDSSVDYYATLTIRNEKVSGKYSTKQLETVIEGMLDAIGTAGFDEYDPSSTASRNLLGQKGIYGNYTGTLTTGAKIAGRVHATCVDNVLYTIHITYPYAYRDTYIDNVFHHLRDTIKITH